METHEIFNENDEFTVWQESAVDILKSVEGKKDNGEESRRIGGYCSTEAIDRQGEILLQKGLDFSEFVNHGYFNDNHSKKTTDVIGIPLSVEYRAGRGWYTTGHLIKGYGPAEEVWKLAKSLEGTRRRLGFSVEGKVMERQNNKVLKAIIRNVAITNAPVNTACSWDALSKAFSVGTSLAPTKGGQVVVPQDLEHDEVRKVWTCGKKGCDKAFRSAAGLDRHLEAAHDEDVSKSLEVEDRLVRKHGLSHEEAVNFLRRIRPNFRDTTLDRIVRHALKGA